MGTRAKKVLAGVAALAALAFGGAAIAQAGGGGSNQSAAPATPSEQQGESNAPENSATDTDNVQSENGDQAEGPETGNQAEGPETGNEADGPEKGGMAEGKEVPGDDGPGGHADEAPNASASGGSQSQK